MSRLAFLALLALLAAGGLRIAHASSFTVASERLTTDTVGTCTAAADLDTYVDQLLSVTSFGTETEVRVRSQLSANRRAFVHLNLSPCAIPGSATVVSAELRLVLTGAPGSSRTHDAHRVTSSWNESVPWSGMPAVAASATASAATGTTSGATITWNVLADVQAFVAGTATNYGWRLADATESAAVGVEARYGAREHGTATSRPVLFVTWRS